MKGQPGEPLSACSFSRLSMPLPECLHLPLTDNQVIAFIIAVLISFILFTGFDSLAYLPGLKKVDEFIIRLGINEHYKSMSRGVLDLRDVIYFHLPSMIFNEATRLVSRIV